MDFSEIKDEGDGQQGLPQGEDNPGIIWIVRDRMHLDLVDPDVDKDGFPKSFLSKRLGAKDRIMALPSLE